MLDWAGMLTSVSVTNYRSFADPTLLELRPLTLLFGQNNSGKSALLRLLPWLADSASARSRGPLDLTSRAVRGASFAELHTRPPLSSRPEIDFTLTWATRKLDPTPISYQVTVRSFPELRRNLIRRFTVTGWGVAAEVIELDPSFEPAAEDLLYFQRPTADALESTSELRFSGLIPTLSPGSEGHPLRAHLAGLSEPLTELHNGVQWLGSIRSLPEREVAFWGEPPVLISPEGGGTIELLIADQLRDRELFPAVSSWFERHLGLRLDVEARSDRFAVVLSPKMEPTLRVNLLDTGEGITQVLPVIAAIERARPATAHRRLLALEQPELHLHPAAQRTLGDYLCEVATAPDPPTLVVETHSENLLLSVQLAAVKQRLARDRVAIYWIRSFPDGRSRAELLPLDELGHPQGWPHEVFRERLEQSRALVSARLELEQP
ncbi:MAG: ATP-binding protein [Thermoanaerobaculia bacterium]|nr:ATP-binding protein [Thermoanaerobaculia bacterium]